MFVEHLCVKSRMIEPTKMSPSIYPIDDVTVERERRRIQQEQHFPQKMFVRACGAVVSLLQGSGGCCALFDIAYS